MADILGFPHGARPGDFVPSDVEPPCEGQGLESVVANLPQPVQFSQAGQILAEAHSLIDGDRDRQHGPREVQFAECAKAWSWYLGRKITPHDVAMLNLLQKISRIKCGHHNRDNYVDLCGYGAIAEEMSK